MKPSEMLREAARRIAKGESRSGLCLALRNIAYELYVDSIAAYNSYDIVADRALAWAWMIAPLGSRSDSYWFGQPTLQGGDQSLRILAACMAAAIAEENGE